MYKFIKKALPILAFIISFAVVKYGFEIYGQYNKEEVLKNAIDDTLLILQEGVKTDASNRTESEKVYDAAQDLINQKLNENKSAGSNKKAVAFATGVFAGQYLRVTRVTLDYCKTLGVDITPFVSRYKNMHKSLYEHTRKTLKEDGSSYELIFRLTKDKLLPYVKKEISDINDLLSSQINRQLPLSDSCVFFNELAKDDVAMSDVGFANVAPEPYKILINSM